MKTTFFFTTVAIAAFLTATTANASSINFASLVGQTVPLTVEPYASGENNGAYYVGLTEGIINGQSFLMYCVDFADEISVPITYNVTVEGLTASTFTGDHMGLTLSQLRQINTLGLNFGDSIPGVKQTNINSQELIWNYSGATYPLNADMTALRNSMLSSYSSRNYSNSFLLESGHGLQDFMPVDSKGTVPEPGSLLISVWGLGLIVIGWRRRKKEN